MEHLPTIGFRWTSPHELNRIAPVAPQKAEGFRATDNKKQFHKKIVAAGGVL